MFGIDSGELLIIAVVALVVIGPKDLPRVMRVVGQWVGRARGMARHFRSGIDTMIREAELEEMEKQWKANNERIMKDSPSADAPSADASVTDSPSTDSGWGQPAPSEPPAPAQEMLPLSAEPEAPASPKPKAPPRRPARPRKSKATPPIPTAPPAADDRP